MTSINNYITDKMVPGVSKGREPGWVPPELKLIPQLPCEDSNCTPEELMEALVSSLKAENERFKAQLPANIVAEYALGESDLLDNINLTDAAYVTSARYPTG